MKTHPEPPPEFNSWDEVWAEHQRRGKTIIAQDTTIRVLREGLEKIAAKYHSDRSCSLEAQGYDRADCERIAAEDYLAYIARAALAAAAKGGE